MVDKIQLCKDNHKELSYIDVDGYKNISFNQICNWHKWLLDNQKKYFLENFYKVENDRLIGIPLFKDQSLKKPLPLTQEDIKSSLNKILNIIIQRGEKINDCLQFSIQ